MTIIDYKVDPTTIATLDAITVQPDIAYWRNEVGDYITNEKHLEYLNSLNIFTDINVPTIISALKFNGLNNTVEEDINPLVDSVGTDVLIENLANVDIVSPTPGDLLIWDIDNKIRNLPKPDIQYKHDSTLWSTTGEGEDDNFWDTFTSNEDTEADRDNAADWNIIGRAYLTSNCEDTANYKITVNFVCSVSSNNRAMKFGIFVNSKEIESFTQEFNFSKKNEQKSITIIEFIKDIKKGDTISLRAQRGNSNRTTLSIGRRSIFIEELR